jgi:hypothetical protein
MYGGGTRAVILGLKQTEETVAAVTGDLSLDQLPIAFRMTRHGASHRRTVLYPLRFKAAFNITILGL